MANKNILMICYYFPPLTDVGCKRSVALARYLKANNWNPFVLSVKNPDKSYCTLGNDLPPAGVPVDYSYSLVNPSKFLGKLNGIMGRILGVFNIRLKRNYFYEFFCIPDLFVGWVPLTVIKALKIIKQNDIEYLYVSCSPFSASLIGVVCRFLTGKKLILDYRDPYGLKTSVNSKKRFRLKVDRLIAGFFLRNADIFFVTTDETRKEYKKQFFGIEDKIFTVHNGFDVSFLIDKKKKFDKFTIIYAGQFYHNFDFSLNMFADNFFLALAKLKKEKTITGDSFQFLFYGSEYEVIKNYARKYEIEDLVCANPRIEYAKVIESLIRSHLQLLRIVKLMLSTKLFEGIPLNIPFLATIPEGEAEEIIRRYSPSSYIVTDDSVDEITSAVKKVMTEYNNGEILDNHVEDFLSCFSRESLTRKFLDKLENNLQGL